MKKKVVSLLAAMALAVTALAGCGSNDAATTGTDAATVAATAIEPFSRVLLER